MSPSQNARLCGFFQTVEELKTKYASSDIVVLVGLVGHPWSRLTMKSTGSDSLRPWSAFCYIGS